MVEHHSKFFWAWMHPTNLILIFTTVGLNWPWKTKFQILYINVFLHSEEKNAFAWTSDLWNRTRSDKNETKPGSSFAQIDLCRKKVMSAANCRPRLAESAKNDSPSLHFYINWKRTTSIFQWKVNFIWRQGTSRWSCGWLRIGKTWVLILLQEIILFFLPCTKKKNLTVQRMALIVLLRKIISQKVQR